MKYVLILCLGVIAMSGCHSYTFKGSKLAKEEEKLGTVLLDLSERQKQLTTATLDVLTAPGAPETNANVLVATELARGNQTLSGTPMYRMDIKPILCDVRKMMVSLSPETNRLSLEEMMQDMQVGMTNQAWVGMQESLREDGKLLEEVRDSREEVQKAEDALVSKAAFQEKLEVKQFWKSTGFWTKVVVVVGGFIALCIFVPAVLPIFGSVLAFIIGKIPSLINMVGVVGKGTLDAVIEGVGNGKKAAKEIDAKSVLSTGKASYSSDEVLNMLESFKAKLINTYKVNLSATTSDMDKSIISTREQEVVGRDIKV